jgi:hypothetical protein
VADVTSKTGKRLCGAKARSRGGQPCLQPAMKNGRCRFHGGLSTGAKTPEGRARLVTNFKHGRRSKAFVEEQRRKRQLMRECKAMLDEVAKLAGW